MWLTIVALERDPLGPRPCPASDLDPELPHIKKYLKLVKNKVQTDRT